MKIINERLEDLREEFEKIKMHQIREKKSLTLRENGESTSSRYAVSTAMLTCLAKTFDSMRLMIFQ